MLNFDEVNDILNDLAEQGIISDPMVEPIDDPSVEVNFLDYVEVIGIDIDDYVPPEYDHA
jgi:hypothetical protein